MASQFIGLQMLVTIGNPATRLRGTVSEVEAGLSLTLSNVWMLDTNRWEPRVTIQAKDIIDLTEVPPAAPPNPFVAPTAVPAPTGHPQIAPSSSGPQQAPRQPFTDPAILAVGNRPGAPKHGSDARNFPGTAGTRDPQPAEIPTIRVGGTSQDATPTGTASASLKDLKISEPTPVVPVAAVGEAPPAAVPVEEGQATAPKKKRRQRKSANARNGVQEDGDVLPQANRVKQTDNGKGWRQTPILQSSATFQPYNSLKKHSGKGGATNDNGWASEDVTDVQEMGDFDFEGALAKFDKRNLFEQMRQDDQVDEADRLVAHNRQSRPKPGTAGGKNLHYSETVLDVPPTIPKPSKDRPTRERSNDFWNSEADDGVLNGGERLSGRDLGSRQSSRRGESKMSTSRRSQSRKASATTTGQGPTKKANSGVSHHQVRTARSKEANRRSSRTLIDKKKQLNDSMSAKAFHLLPSTRRVETVSALQMLNLENIAHNELGLTEDMMTENAGRGIAEVSLTALTDPAIKVRNAASVDPATGSSPPPTVVILAGNNKSGIRAVATGRHLHNKGISVLVCVVGIERGERELLEDMRQQVRLFRNFGGRVFSKIDLFDYLRKASIPMLTIDTPRTASLTKPATVTLIVDALLGLAISFEELRTGDQATVYELMEWSNRNDAFVLAVDVPSGIDPSSGKVNIIDSSPLYIKPRYVVSIGAPKRGLVEAMAAGDDDNGESVPGNAALPDDNVSEWKLFVADLGLGAAVWKKAGTKIRRGIDFDDKWVLEMKYQSTPSEEDGLV